MSVLPTYKKRSPTLLLIHVVCMCIVLLSVVCRFSLITIQSEILLHQMVIAGSSQAYLFACRMCDGKSSDSTHRSSRIRDSS